MAAKFGPAGTGDDFKAKRYKSSLDVPNYLLDMGLDHFEYQCGRGVNIGIEKATELGKIAKEKGITISLHAPYYISMSSVEEEKRLNSVNYILDSARAVKAMGGNRIIVHTGSCGKISREEALTLAIDTMKLSQKALDDEGLSDIHICPETMGKINQLGTLEEVLTFCKAEERFLPCVDFGHLNSRTLGETNSREAYAAVIDAIGEALGEERQRSFHIHFSKIEYTGGGEKKHLTFEDAVFGPDPKPLMELLAERGLCPTIICESAGTQTVDSATMSRLYAAALE